jgi:RHS repeat-associated protein
MTMTSQLSENSHQGFDGIKAGLCLASTRVNSNTASGMPLCLWRNGIRSRSTGKERDPETGLDYFGARYYSAAQGRFSSTDPFNPILEMTNEEGFYAYISQPQNWNRYAYTWNNPLRFIDPSGKLVELMGDSTLQAKEKARIEAMIGGITLEYDVVGSHTYLKYTGTQQLGHFGQMLTGAQTIEFTISDTYKTKYGSGFSVFSKGGGVTVGSHESDNGHIQIFVMNKAGDRATEVGRGRLMWTCSSDGGPLYFTNDIVDAHEFGHAWGEFWGGFYIGGDYSYVTNLSAIAWENLARRRYKVQGNPAYQNYRKWHNPNLWRPPNDPPGY